MSRLDLIITYSTHAQSALTLAALKLFTGNLLTALLVSLAVRIWGRGGRGRMEGERREKRREEGRESTCEDAARYL